MFLCVIRSEEVVLCSPFSTLPGTRSRGHYGGASRRHGFGERVRLAAHPRAGPHPLPTFRTGEPPHATGDVRNHAFPKGGSVGPRKGVGSTRESSPRPLRRSVPAPGPGASRPSLPGHSQASASPAATCRTQGGKVGVHARPPVPDRSAQLNPALAGPPAVRSPLGSRNAPTSAHGGPTGPTGADPSVLCAHPHAQLVAGCGRASSRLPCHFEDCSTDLAFLRTGHANSASALFPQRKRQRDKTAQFGVRFAQSGAQVSDAFFRNP